MQGPVRIYLVGAHATGKTTLARWIRDRYGLPMIAEVARGVLAEMEARLESLRTDLNLVNRYQAQVFERQLEAEAAQVGSFVSDRAFCNLAYAAQHATILAEVFRDPRLATYMDSVRKGVVFYLRPHKALLAEDGVRAGVDWDEVVRIDGMVKLMLEMFDVPYLPVESLAMQERVRLVERVLDLAGLHRAQAPSSYLQSAAAEHAPTPVAFEASALDAVEARVAANGNGNGSGSGSGSGNGEREGNGSARGASAATRS